MLYKKYNFSFDNIEGALRYGFISVVEVFSSRRRIFLKCETVKKIDYSNMSVSQSPTRTFVQIQKQMSMSMDRLCKTFYRKVLDIYGRGKNSPEDLIKVKG